MNFDPYVSIDLANPEFVATWEAQSHILLALSMIKAASAGKKPSLLDVGCGRARWKQRYEQMGFQYTGVDIEPALEPDVVANAESLPFEDNSFDVILLNSVLEQSPDPSGTLEESARVLRSDGKLVLGIHAVIPTPAALFDHIRISSAEVMELAQRFELSCVYTGPPRRILSLCHLSEQLNARLGRSAVSSLIIRSMNLVGWLLLRLDAEKVRPDTYFVFVGSKLAKPI